MEGSRNRKRETLYYLALLVDVKIKSSILRLSDYAGLEDQLTEQGVFSVETRPQTQDIVPTLMN